MSHRRRCAALLEPVAEATILLAIVRVSWKPSSIRLCQLHSCAPRTALWPDVRSSRRSFRRCEKAFCSAFGKLVFFVRKSAAEAPHTCLAGLNLRYDELVTGTARLSIKVDLSGRPGRIDTDEGGTIEWKSRALWVYDLRLAFNALIDAVHLLGCTVIIINERFATLVNGPE